MPDHTEEQFGDYRLTQLLSKGNFGDVYLGVHIKNQNQAAIKVLQARLTSKEDLKDYINELRSLFRLEHPNIVQLRDFGVERDYPFFVMDYNPNGRLRQPKGTRLPLGTIVSYIKQISEALQYAHEQGIIHRDVKPDNILLGPHSQVWLSDFGIAAVAHSTNSFNNQGNAGTIAYMAPEQIQGNPGKASDQYAIGVMTYEWICGIRPFNGTASEIHNQHLFTPPPSMCGHVPTLSPLVEEVVMKALVKDPKQRFANLRAFANALEQAYLASLLPVQEPPVVMEPLPQIPNRQSAVSSMAIPFPSPVQQSATPVVVAPHLIMSGNDGVEAQKISSQLQSNTSFPEPSKRKNGRRWLFIIAPIVLIALSVTSVIFAVNGGLLALSHTSRVTNTVIITPKHPKVTDSFIVPAVTGTPDPMAQQVRARILSYTSPSGSGSANATGAIQGVNATGTLVFINIGNFGVNVSSGILTGADGVQVSYGSFSLPVGSVNVLGTVTSQGAGGNIRSLDINGTCCGSSNIIVRNATAFSGGQDPVPNSIITQNDINSASNKLVSSLTPGAQTALQQQVQAGEQAVSSSLKCTPNNLSSNQRVGDQAKSVTMTGTVTCREEVYDQKGALSIGVNALKAEVAKNLGPHYVLVGNVVASVRLLTSINANGTISLVVDAQGQWVYHFTDADLTAIKNKLAKEAQSTAQSDVNKTAGVESAVIKISSGTTMPDAANITINVVSFAGVILTPTPTSSTTPTGSPAITPTSGLGNGQKVMPSPVLGGS